MMKWIVLVWGIACVAQASPELDRVFTIMKHANFIWIKWLHQPRSRTV